MGTSVIPLTPFLHKKFTLIDNDDFNLVNCWRWRFDGEYASRRKNKKKIYLHRLINKTPEGKITDHINRNKLDNRKVNLKTVNKSGNQRNHKIFKTNTSGYSGISWCKNIKKWEVYIWKNNIKIGLGYFDELEQAKVIRKKAEMELWKNG
jgi:hypothetical protein